MEEVYASLGRKQIELDALNVQYDNLLAVFAKVGNGEIDAKRVSVDLAARSWHLIPENVAPICIVEESAA